MNNELLLLIFALLGTVVGYLIGNSKGRGLLGAGLGFFLGFIGWIIIAVIPAKK